MRRRAAELRDASHRAIQEGGSSSRSSNSLVRDLIEGRLNVAETSQQLLTGRNVRRSNLLPRIETLNYITVILSEISASYTSTSALRIYIFDTYIKNLVFALSFVTLFRCFPTSVSALERISKADKIFYKVVYHYIIYMCDFFDKFR